MQRFAALIQHGLESSGVEVRTIKPEPFFGRLREREYGIGKWLGYLDKFMLFPPKIRKAVQWADVVHICDHSNGFYTKHAAGKPCLLTCHDLLAIRSGLGEDTDCPISYTGKVLQKWIFSGLPHATWIVNVSTYTQNDLRRLAGDEVAGRSSVILQGLNQPFCQLEPQEAKARLEGVLDLSQPFLLCVGRNSLRKNRRGMLRLLKELKGRWTGKLVIAGEPMDKMHRNLMHSLGVQDQVIEVIKPSDQVLEALYNTAHALLFISSFEGFGWPVIEAQACGCPVISSDRTSLPEVAGEGAIICPLEDTASMAQAVIALEDESTRAGIIDKGLINVERFKTQRMINDYIDTYRSLMHAKHEQGSSRPSNVAASSA